MTGLGGFCNLLYNVHVFYIYIHTHMCNVLFFQDNKCAASMQRSVFQILS